MRRFAYVFIGICCLVVPYFTYRRSLVRKTLIPGIRLGQEILSPSLSPAQLKNQLSKRAAALNAHHLVLLVGKRQVAQLSTIDAGMRIDISQSLRSALRIGKSGSLIRDVRDRIKARRGEVSLPIRIDIDFLRISRLLRRIATQENREPRPPRLNLEADRILPSIIGRTLMIDASIAAIESAFRSGERAVSLPFDTEEAPGTEHLKDLSIRNVLGHFTTVYSLKSNDVNRAHNLKLIGLKINGTILGPGERFSYNQVVGPRDAENGYRIAHVISAGEMVDGMAGGACQISSTLFAAAFFSGMDLVSSRPHSRPSSYIKMGFDATVAYPDVDFVFKNPYPFPVVIHIRVNQGKVLARILGKKRPWERVVFEREILTTGPFERIERADPTLPVGQQIGVQVGVPAYTLERRRLMWKTNSALPMREKRLLRYPATREIVRVGSGPLSAEKTEKSSAISAQSSDESTQSKIETRQKPKEIFSITQ